MGGKAAAEYTHPGSPWHVHPPSCAACAASAAPPEKLLSPWRQPSPARPVRAARTCHAVSDVRSECHADARATGSAEARMWKGCFKKMKKKHCESLIKRWMGEDLGVNCQAVFSVERQQSFLIGTVSRMVAGPPILQKVMLCSSRWFCGFRL